MAAVRYLFRVDGKPNDLYVSAPFDPDQVSEAAAREMFADTHPGLTVHRVERLPTPALTEGDSCPPDTSAR